LHLFPNLNSEARVSKFRLISARRNDVKSKKTVCKISPVALTLTPLFGIFNSFYFIRNFLSFPISISENFLWTERPDFAFSRR
jgi:hypothetical protein